MAMPEIRASLGFSKISHPKKNKMTSNNKKGKPRPRNVMTHHFCGLR
jgi:hypothetical protein